METLNLMDNLLLRWRQPFRAGSRRRGAAFLLLPNTEGHGRAVARTVDPLVRPSGGPK